MQKKFMSEAIQLAHNGVNQSQGGPFGAVIVKENKIIGRGFNQVINNFDPTAHAEIVAIREACKYLNNFWLEGCEIYTNCEPCPMCLGAIYWAHLDKIFYAADRGDAAKIGFDDSFFYDELNKKMENRKIKMMQLMRDDALVVFKEWENKQDKIRY